MADAGTSARGIAHDLTRAFRMLNLEQRVAAVAALLLIASTFGPFSFVEAAEIVIAGAILALLYMRGSGRAFHLPFGDGSVIAAAGVWAGLLIVIRLLDRPLGQNLLALACAAILTLAGLRERAKRPADDVAAEPRRPAPWPQQRPEQRPERRPAPRPAAARKPALPARERDGEQATSRQLSLEDDEPPPDPRGADAA